MLFARAMRASRRALASAQKSFSALLQKKGVLPTGSIGGVVGGVIRCAKVLFGHKFDPVRELHTPTTALAENAILVGNTEYHRVKDFCSSCIENLNHHLKLGVVQGLGGKFRSLSMVVDLRAWDS